MLWEQQIVNTERGSFEMFVRGEGPPLAVTHLYSEFNQTGDYFAQSFTEYNRVFLINLRGCGESEEPHETYQFSMLESVLDLESIRRALGFSQWSFAAHSTGAMLGVLYGVHASPFIRDMILVGGGAREYMSDTPSCIYHTGHAKYEQMQRYLELLKREDLSEEERKEVKRSRTQLSLYRPELHDAYFSSGIEKGLSAKRLNFFSRELHIFDLTRKLPLIDCDVLIACGRHDVQCPLLFSEEMKDRIPKARLIIFEESNHYPFLEEKENFRRTVRDWRLRKEK
ncbi:alpha/beta hydrolase [Halobacillus locisalis]|uniref:Alpha/beta hydrolase n=1 Tax=Halobacillus locisalis TaxID=220753 RepID=A0A838CPB6_9BACI|nr:alpha/beta hydrolase [Halobacillus locisalis]MBA2173733.1 alpha/beta hydrolase [Halobacillus locisalis]